MTLRATRDRKIEVRKDMPAPPPPKKKTKAPSGCCVEEVLGWEKKPWFT